MRDTTGFLLSFCVWFSFLSFAYIAKRDRTKTDWYICERFFHFSGLKYIFRKFVPQCHNSLPTGWIWLLGIYFATYAFTSQRYENFLYRVEFRYNTFTSQISAGNPFSNEGLMSILHERIPVEPYILSPTSILKSLLYNKKHYSFFFQSHYSSGEKFQSASKVRQEIINQWRMKLQHADFLGANLQKTKLDYLDLEGASFRSADLKSAFFRGSNLKNADFFWTQLEETIFERCNLKGVTFKHSKLIRTCFDRVDIDGADFSNRDLSALRFIETSLKNANFTNSNLSGVIFSWSDLEGANLKDVKFLFAEQLLIAKNIYGIRNCPPMIIKRIKELGCSEMLLKRPNEWSKEFKDYHSKHSGEWVNSVYSLRDLIKLLQNKKSP